MKKYLSCRLTLLKDRDGGQPQAGTIALRAGAGKAVVAHGAASAARVLGQRSRHEAARRVRARHRAGGEANQAGINQSRDIFLQLQTETKQDCKFKWYNRTI